MKEEKKSNELNISVDIGYIDFETASDPLENELVFKALRTIGATETFVVILGDDFIGTTARVQMDKQL